MINFQENKRVKLKRALINSSSDNHLSLKEVVTEENKEIKNTDNDTMSQLPKINAKNEGQIYKVDKETDMSGPQIIKIIKKKNNCNKEI